MKTGLAAVVLGVVLLLGCGASRVAAQEVRILDSAGLVRAVRPAVNPVRVEVAVVGGEAKRLAGATLVQTTGLAEDRNATIEGRGYIFEAIPPGTWQITLRAASEQVSSVRIAASGAHPAGK
jgi:hypothetical protein